jgi:phospholipid-binding lipoprotein MlaA
MLRRFEFRDHTFVLATLVVLCSASVGSAPVFAQSTTATNDTSTQPIDPQNAPTPSAPTATPAVTATPSPEPAAAEDAQLPAYLQSNPNAEAESEIPDPWERYNRHVYHFNKKVDERIAKPLAQTYQRVVPKPVRNGVSHFFYNLRQPVTAANLLLQGHPGRSVKSLCRFAIDSTIGIGGLFDPATAMHIPQFSEDFGQTMGRWGWRHSRYFLLPFFGPGTLRDRLGALVDNQYSWNHFVENDRTRVGLLGLSLIDTRVRVLPLDELGQGVDDDYVLVREAWGQRRNHQIDDQTAQTNDETNPPVEQ